MHDLEAYRAFIGDLGPLGYGLLYVKTGDFTRSQHALQQALVKGAGYWQRREPQARSRARLMSDLVSHFSRQETSLPSDPPPEDSSFARSQKVQALRGALELLRSFPRDEQLAIFLLHVEEVEEARVLAWLDQRPDFLEGVRSRLKEKLAGWTPGLATGEDSEAFFFRALRQYRLSAQFLPSLLQQLKSTRRSWAGLARGIGWVAVLALPLLVLPQLVHLYLYSRGNEIHESEALATPMLVDFSIALLAHLFKRFLDRHAPIALSEGPGKVLGPLLGLGAMTGFGFTACALLVLVVPRYHFHDEGYGFWLLLQGVWRLFALGTLMIAGYRVAVHFLSRRDGKGDLRDPRRVP